jgi:hypothetical protein
MSSLVVGTTPPPAPQVAYVPVRPTATPALKTLALQAAYVPFQQTGPTQTEVVVDFGRTMEYGYAWLRPLFDFYQSNRVPFRYATPLNLSATRAGFASVDPPDRSMGATGADGYELNAFVGDGISFSGAIYIDTSARYRLVVRSYDSKPGAIGTVRTNLLMAYLDSARCATNIRVCVVPLSNQVWKDSKGTSLPITTGHAMSYTPISQPPMSPLLPPTYGPLATHAMR